MPCSSPKLLVRIFVFVTFLMAMTNCLAKETSERNGFFWLSSEVQSIKGRRHGGGSLRQLGHIVSVVRKQREAHWCSAHFLLLIHSEISAHGEVMLKSRAHFLSVLNFLPGMARGLSPRKF